MKQSGVSQAILCVRKTYEDAYHGVLQAAEEDEDGELVSDFMARRAGAEAACAALPQLTSKAAISDYIGCIAWMQGRKILEPAEVKAHMYTAQLALAAFESGGRNASK